MAIKRQELEKALDAELQVRKFKDYCPNGLQVEGRDSIRKIVSGVTASQALIDAAVIADADAILVHHGYFWKGENPVLTGMKRQRLHTLLKHDINLLAYHLPLDAHPVLGNNAQLARVLDFQVEGGMELGNPLSIGLQGRLPEVMSASALREHLVGALGREVLHIGEPEDEIETIAWCTGAAQNFIDQAEALGMDAYLSGEISEQTVHYARETGVHYFACGHHATERYGVQALGEWIARQCGIQHQFIAIDNPV